MPRAFSTAFRQLSASFGHNEQVLLSSYHVFNNNSDMLTIPERGTLICSENGRCTTQMPAKGKFFVEIRQVFKQSPSLPRSAVGQKNLNTGSTLTNSMQKIQVRQYCKSYLGFSRFCNNFGDLNIWHRRSHVDDLETGK